MREYEFVLFLMIFQATTSNFEPQVRKRFKQLLGLRSVSGCFYKKSAVLRMAEMVINVKEKTEKEASLLKNREVFWFSFIMFNLISLLIFERFWPKCIPSFFSICSYENFKG